MTFEIPDLDAIIKGWAMQMFECTKSKEQGKIAKDCLMLTIDWRNVRCKHHVPQYTEMEKPAVPKAQVLFKTFFSNNTDTEQEYSFKTERVTRSCCEVVIEKGVTTGHEMSVKLQTTCEVFEANAGFHREVTLSSSGEIIEEELKWEGDSQIKVPARTRTTAELIVKEDQYSGKFLVVSELLGKIHASFNNLSDNNSFVKAIAGDLSEIIKNAAEKGSKGFTVRRKVVSYETTGECKFRFAVEQYVRLSQEPIEE